MLGRNHVHLKYLHPKRPAQSASLSYLFIRTLLLYHFFLHFRNLGEVFLKRIENCNHQNDRGHNGRNHKTGQITGHDGGCRLLQPKLRENPNIARIARIPEFVMVLPHFCAKPFTEDMTPFNCFPSLSMIKSIVSLTSTLTNAFTLAPTQVAIKDMMPHHIKFILPVKNSSKYKAIVKT